MEPTEMENSGTFTNHHGLKIFYRNWNSNNAPKGIVLIVHGLNSHSGYYQNFAKALNESDFEVFAIDLFGRGKSEGERYYISNYFDVLLDIDQLVAISKASYPALPLFLLGHSAGGVFASVYAIHHQYKFDGLISESLAFQIPVPNFAISLIKFLSHFIPHLKLIKLKNEDFSRDKFTVENMNNDPFIRNERQPIKTMQQLFLAAEYLRQEVSKIALPILVLHGTADHATKPSGSEYLVNYCSSTEKQLKLYEGHYHDLINDKYNGIVIRDIIRWLNIRTTHTGIALYSST